jgi:hypothetical protein
MTQDARAAFVRIASNGRARKARAPGRMPGRDFRPARALSSPSATGRYTSRMIVTGPSLTSSSAM